MTPRPRNFKDWPPELHKEAASKGGSASSPKKGFGSMSAERLKAVSDKGRAARKKTLTPDE